LLALAAGACPADDKKERPNVIFILADDLGWTDLGCQGSKYYETPNVDRLAKQGMRFTHGYSCGPNCQPTRAALMSGQYGPRTGVYTVGGIDRFDWKSRPLRPVDNVVNLPLDRVTLAQSLKAAGYKTGMFGKWHLGQQGKHHPGERGFDEAIVSMGKHFDFNTSPKVDYPKGTYLADFLTDKAVAFIRKNKDGPFFLYLPHFGVHSPFQAKPELIKKFKEKKGVGGHDDPVYAAMIASVDDSVGRILKELDELKLSERTLVIFSSDNGGVGGYAREGLGKNKTPTDNAPLRGGKGMLYEGGIRVPYIFRWKGKIKEGVVSEEPINSVDLYPTLLEVCGAKAPAKQPLDGESYSKLLTGDGKLKREAIYWHFPGYLGQGKDRWRTTPAGAIRAGEWKLIEFFEDGRLELYNVKEDVGEKKDLSKQKPDVVKDLHGKLLAWRKEIKAPMPTANKPKKDKP
jgi:arylsulfatase A-like enzyme